MNVRIFLAGILLAAVMVVKPALADAPTSAAAAVQIGDSEADVKRKLGEPRSELATGSRAVLDYPQGQFVLINGRVTEISGNIPPASPSPSRSPASVPTTAPSTATPHPPDVSLVERPDGNGVVTLVAQSDTNTDYTVTIQCDLTNMTSSQPLPYTADSGGKKSFVLLQLRRQDATKAWKYTNHFDFRVGGRGGAKTNDTVYQLPYPTTESHRLVQGNFGKFSHFEGSGNEHAFDFECPPGTFVCAARAGVVTGVRQDYTEGGTDPKFKAMGNYVIIRHDDGTYAEYYHLEHNGALVQLGQHVGAGQHIALSGATGYAEGPHIHFAVFENIDGKNRVTLPVRFQTKQGVLDTLKEGETY